MVTTKRSDWRIALHRLLLVAMMLVLCTHVAYAELEADSSGTLYVVGTSHLDTQWRWTIQETINEYIPNTLHENFALFDQFPDYTFSFEGSFRYRLMKEYYPAEYERLKGYMRDGRWRVTGSWVDAVDVNVPSPESLIRHTLYGNGFFREEFGQSSVDIYLPDCFGFGYALPTIARHSGLRGFSTQKLGWGCWVGKPFDIGRWRGVDGSEIIAAVNPDAYVSKLRVDLSADSSWRANVERQREVSDIAVGYKYFGVGDIGGGPDSLSVANLEQAINDPTGPLEVKSVAADQLYRDISDEQMAQLPLYDGELIMTSHGVGCYTSQSAMKRWNAQNENLAQAAERAAVLAHLLGGYEYPRNTLREAWERFLWHQFHDDLTGTSIPEAYAFSWNDELLSLDQFSEILQDAVGSIASSMDTNVEGIPLVVYNPLAFGATRKVETWIEFDDEVPDYLATVSESGNNGVVQILERVGNRARIAFQKQLPPVSISVVEIQAIPAPLPVRTDMAQPFTSPTVLRDRGLHEVRIDDNGDISHIITSGSNQFNSLSSPIRLAVYENEPRSWAAWEIDYDDIMAEPVGYVTGPAEIKVIEEGPSRQAVEVIRHFRDSEIRQIVRLEHGGVEVENIIDWREPHSLLKAEFHPRASNENATYNLGFGTIERGTNTEDRYEVPAQNWAGLTGTEYENPWEFGVVSDSRYGWDHPEPDKLRLTLIHTPGVNQNWRWIEDQRSQDIGVHRTTFKAFYTARATTLNYETAMLLQPVRTFIAEKSGGPLGREISLLDPERSRYHWSKDPVSVVTLKLAEHSDEIIVRVVNQTDEAVSSQSLQFAMPILSAREVNGQEDEIGPAKVVDGELVFDIGPYQPKAFAVKLAPLDVQTEPLFSTPVELPYNHDGISFDDDRTAGDLDGTGYTIPGELWPEEIVREGIRFVTADAAADANLVRCEGQTIELPDHPDDAELVVLASSIGGHRTVDFAVGDSEIARRVNAIDGFIGQWNSRLVGDRFVEDPDEILPAWIETEPVAWVGTHRHTPDGENEAYTFNYFYKLRLPLTADAKTVTLPDNPHIIVAAATVVDNPRFVESTLPLYDTDKAVFPVIESPVLSFAEQMDVELSCRWADASIHYTLDGSEPTPDSPTYTEPFTVSSSVTVSAAAFLDGYESHVVRADFEKLEPIPGVQVGDVQPGLSCSLYHGEWDLMPDLSQFTPVLEKVVHEVALVAEAPDELFGQLMTGYLHVPETGLYTLSISSDDGSMLYLDGELVIDNDGLHGAVAIEGRSMLEAGYHPIRIEMFQKKGGRALSASITDPDGNVSPLNDTWLFINK